MKKITLDATIKSTLKWVLPEIEKEDVIAWTLDLGLERLQKPLTDVQQCSALKLACDYFIESVYSKYENETESVLFFQGSLKDFFERDAFSDYLDIITANVPKSLKMKVIFEADPTLHPIINAQLYNQEAFPRFAVTVKNLTQKKEAPLALLLPPKNVFEESVMDALRKKVEEKADYRIISETELLYQFGGLDEVIYHAESISSEGRRVLAGFAAASGILTEC